MKLNEEENIELLVKTRSNTSADHEPIFTIAKANGCTQDEARAYIKGLQERGLVMVAGTVAHGRPWKSTYGWARNRPASQS
jgi:hypothetical protein